MNHGCVRLTSSAPKDIQIPTVSPGMGDVGWLTTSHDYVLKSQAICIGTPISGERHRLSGSRKHVRLARSPTLIEAGDAGIEDLIPLEAVPAQASDEEMCDQTDPSSQTTLRKFSYMKAPMGRLKS